MARGETECRRLQGAFAPMSLPCCRRGRTASFSPVTTTRPGSTASTATRQRFLALDAIHALCAIPEGLCRRSPRTRRIPMTTPPFGNFYRALCSPCGSNTPNSTAGRAGPLRTLTCDNPARLHRPAPPRETAKCLVMVSLSDREETARVSDRGQACLSAAGRDVVTGEAVRVEGGAVRLRAYGVMVGRLSDPIPGTSADPANRREACADKRPLFLVRRLSGHGQAPDLASNPPFTHPSLRGKGRH